MDYKELVKISDGLLDGSKMSLKVLGFKGIGECDGRPCYGMKLGKGYIKGTYGTDEIVCEAPSFNVYVMPGLYNEAGYTVCIGSGDQMFYIHPDNVKRRGGDVRKNIAWASSPVIGKMMSGDILGQWGNMEAILSEAATMAEFDQVDMSSNIERLLNRVVSILG